MEQRPIYDFAVEGPVQAEVFVLFLAEDGIRLTGPCGPEAWYIEVAEDEDPMDVVAAMTQTNMGAPTVAHSTSWRRSRDAVILSFAVVVPPELAQTMDSTPIRRTELARSERTAAPAAIETDQVLEHALRHLAWLVQDDEVVASAIGEGWRETLANYVPQPFRHLT